MTPLVRELMRNLKVEKRRREIYDPAWLQRILTEARYFEMSAAAEATEMLSRSIATTGMFDRKRVFLPAETTILEWRPVWTDSYSGDIRLATLLIESEGGHTARVYWLAPHNYGFLGILGIQEDDAEIHPEPGEKPNFTKQKPRIYAQLTILNSPRIATRVEHTPQSRPQRASVRPTQDYELRPWTEIIIGDHLNDSRRRDASTSIGDTNSAPQRSFHFCRSHLRVKKGRLERVRSHWRGDPSLGIVQSRYVVKPPSTR